MFNCQKPLPWPLPCPMALISTVLGIFSSRFQPEDLRLTWDLNKVLTSVDFPSPLWPRKKKCTKSVTALSCQPIEPLALLLEGRQKVSDQSG